LPERINEIAPKFQLIMPRSVQENRVPVSVARQKRILTQTLLLILSPVINNKKSIDLDILN